MGANARTTTPTRIVVVLLSVLTIGAVAGLVVGGTMRGLGGNRSGNAASAAASKPAPPLPGRAPLAQGAVVADSGAGTLTANVALGQTHTPDGAVTAFTAYAAWLVGSPAAAANPWGAGSVVGGKLINPTDAGFLAIMRRQPGDRFAVEHGAYRVIAHAGSADAPSEVMIEVTAPLTLGGRTEWRTIGGVIGWTPVGWQLVSIEPRAVVQPTNAGDDVRSLSEEERARTLAGPGWQAFRPGPGQ